MQNAWTLVLHVVPTLFKAFFQSAKDCFMWIPVVVIEGPVIVRVFPFNHMKLTIAALR